MIDSTYILAPQLVRVRFDVSPVLNAIESIRSFTEVDRLSGFSAWVMQTVMNLSREQRDLNLLIFSMCSSLFYDVMPVMTSPLDFPGYVDSVAARDPYQLRDALITAQHIAGLSPEQVMHDESLFAKLACHGVPSNEVTLRQAFALYNDPPRLQATIVDHLRWVWSEFLADEWQRVRPMLEESVAAFERMDFSNMTAYEAIRAVTTRELRGILDHHLEIIDTVVFTPSAHIGPYVSRVNLGTTLYVVFGARLPQGVQNMSSALSRSELTIRLNALADDTRLRILELLTRNDELCAQDIIENLNLSQSSISRHLSQLSANGFITERRRDVAKCYSLNSERVSDTLRTLTNFLSRS